MTTRSTNPSALFAGAEDETRGFVFMLAVSALGHLLLLGMIYVVPATIAPPFRAGPRAINVDLVSLPAPGPPAPAPTAPAPAPPPKPKPKAVAPKPVPVPQPPPAVKKEQVSIAPPKKKPKVVQSLKKKTAPKKRTQAAVTRPAPKETKPQRAQQVSSAIDAMKKKVAGQEQARAAAGGGGGAAGGVGVLTRLKNYEIDVVTTVSQNFAFPDHLSARIGNLQTLISFRILPNGEITNIKIDRSSGNSVLDEAAYRAVVKSNPVGPHPEGTNRPYVEIGLRAGPSGFN